MDIFKDSWECFHTFFVADISPQEFRTISIRDLGHNDALQKLTTRFLYLNQSREQAQRFGERGKERNIKLQHYFLAFTEVCSGDTDLETPEGGTLSVEDVPSVHRPAGFLNRTTRNGSDQRGTTTYGSVLLSRVVVVSISITSRGFNALSSPFINYLLFPSAHTSTPSINTHTHTHTVPHQHNFPLAFISFTHPLPIVHEHTHTHTKKDGTRDPFSFPACRGRKLEILKSYPGDGGAVRERKRRKRKEVKSRRG